MGFKKNGLFKSPVNSPEGRKVGIRIKMVDQESINMSATAAIVAGEIALHEKGGNSWVL